MVTRFLQSEVAGVAHFNPIPRTLKDDPRMRPWTQPYRQGKRRCFAEVPIRRFGQHIEEIPLVSHGRPGGGIQVGIGGKAARDHDRLGTPAVGLHRSVEPVGATARTPRRQYHQHEETRSIQAFDFLPIHLVFPPWPGTAAGQNPRYLRIPSINARRSIRKRSIAGRRCLNRITLGIDVAPRCALVFSAPCPA